MRIPYRLLVVCAAVLATSGIVKPTISGAQCTITGPTQVCPGDSIQLCGPVLDNAAYVWRDPDGILYMTDCILVYGPGLYTLQTQDLNTWTWSEPCSLTVTSGRAAAPAITGPVSTCSGTPVNWCGPAGSFDYAWSGPNGFTANTACVAVAAAGDYLLRVRSLPAGCWGDSTVRSLAISICGASTTTNCPRPAWWWAQQGSDHDGRQGRLDRSQLSAVAGCVDDHSTALAWSDGAVGFARTMRSERHTLRLRARRQFAAVWANVCAGQLGVTPRSGAAVALDPSTSLDAGIGGGTIASWLAFADAELARLEGSPERKQSVKDSYRGLIRTGWHINQGLGIGTTCKPDLHEDARLAVQQGMAVNESNVEPLAAQLADDAGGSLEFGALQPNPFSTQTSLAYSVSTTASALVSIAVYDVSGRMIRELVRGPHDPGQYVARWDGIASDGTPAKSGLYFIRGRIGDQLVHSQVTVIR